MRTNENTITEKRKKTKNKSRVKAYQKGMMNKEICSPHLRMKVEFLKGLKFQRQEI